MGDDGRLYVRPEMPAAFAELIAPLASILTPNQFEAEQLTGAWKRSLCSLHASLHLMGVWVRCVALYPWLWDLVRQSSCQGSCD
jgi:pyridoxal/pyridoxine/pyridoxamine kinase